MSTCYQNQKNTELEKLHDKGTAVYKKRNHSATLPKQCHIVFVVAIIYEEGTMQYIKLVKALTNNHIYMCQETQKVNDLHTSSQSCTSRNLMIAA